MDFNGKKILITGSTRGIGKVLAHRFLEGGASVAINGRSPESVDTVVSALSDGSNAFAAHGRRVERART